MIVIAALGLELGLALALAVGFADGDEATAGEGVAVGTADGAGVSVGAIVGVGDAVGLGCENVTGAGLQPAASARNALTPSMRRRTRDDNVTPKE